MTGEHLLGPDPQVEKEIATAKSARAIHGVPFRNTECNSCFHGGQKGVSDSYASALWAADYMLQLMQGGHAGVNLHGGGEGIYSPIVGDAEKGYTRRPLYFGMQFAQAFAGAQMLEVAQPTASGVRSYAARTDKGLLVALLNKSPRPASIKLNLRRHTDGKLTDAYALSGPALDSRTGVSFGRIGNLPVTRKTASWLVPAYSGMLLTFAR